MESPKRWTTYIHPDESARDVARSKNNIEVYKNEEAAFATWPIQNSPLLETVGARSDMSYERTFKEFIPEGTNLKDYIESELARKKGRAIGIDIGGLGSAVFGAFSPGFFARSLGTSLVDSRQIYKVDTAADSERNHDVIAGDLFKQETRNAIATWLNGAKADVIFERMQGGLELVPRDGRMVATVMAGLYELLSDEGMLFLQLRFRQGDDVRYSLLEPGVISAWQRDAQEQAGNTLSIEVDSYEDTVLIRKHPGAPTELPAIDKLREYFARMRSYANNP